MLSPALALLGLLFVFPVLYAGYLGFTNLALVGARSRDYTFTGLDNVVRMLGDYVFVKSAWLTLIFVVGSAIVGQSVLGMALALAAAQRRGSDPTHRRLDRDRRLGAAGDHRRARVVRVLAGGRDAFDPAPP